MPLYPDLARRAFEASAMPAPPRPLAAALRYVTTLLALLPSDERAGYVRGPAGGENVWPLADGTLVRVSRVMYPDGQIVKVLSDAPNGQPQWVLEDVRPDLYVPAAGHPAPQTPGEVGEAVRLTDLEARTQQLLALHAEVVAQLTQINRLQAELSSRVAALSTPPPEPQYVVRVFGYEIPVRKR